MITIEQRKTVGPSVLDGQSTSNPSTPFRLDPSIYAHLDVKKALFDWYDGKCAYCSFQFAQFEDLQVSHFRPSNSVAEDASHPGYYWLAYEWTNLLPTCQSCNVALGNRFPINGTRCNQPPRERAQFALDSSIHLQEEAVLVHPEIDHPEAHLAFDFDGRIRGLSQRGESTIDLLKLNSAARVSARLADISRAFGEIAFSILEDLNSPLSHYSEVTKGQSRFIKVMTTLRIGSLHHRHLASHLPQWLDRPAAGRMRETLGSWFTKVSSFIQAMEDEARPQAVRPDVPIFQDILSFKFSELHFKNFRAFHEKSFTLPPDKHFMLFIGDNGAGKTAVLDGMATLIQRFLFELGIPKDPRRREKEQRLQRRDVTLKRLSNNDAVQMEQQFPCRLSTLVQMGEREYKWSVSRSHIGEVVVEGPEMIEVATQVVDLVQNGAPVTLPIFAYYGTGRLWLQQGVDNLEHTGVQSRFGAYEKCLDPKMDERALYAWMKARELEQLQDGTTLKLYEAVKKAVIQGCKDFEKVWFSVRDDALMIQKKNGDVLPAHLFSDGYRNAMATIADLAYRCALLNPHLGDGVVQQTPGIVLIDEIDLHLHPIWQREIVPMLREVFPQITFFATTHSPIVIQSIQLGALINLSPTDDPIDDLNNASPEDILEHTQGMPMPQVSKRYRDMYKASMAYYELLDQADGADAEELEKIKVELDRLTIPYSDSPAMMAFLERKRLMALKDNA